MHSNQLQYSAAAAGIALASAAEAKKEKKKKMEEEPLTGCVNLVGINTRDFPSIWNPPPGSPRPYCCPSNLSGAGLGRNRQWTGLHDPPLHFPPSRVCVCQLVSSSPASTFPSKEIEKCPQNVRQLAFWFLPPHQTFKRYSRRANCCLFFSCHFSLSLDTRPATISLIYEEIMCVGRPWIHSEKERGKQKRKTGIRAMIDGETLDALKEIHASWSRPGYFFDYFQYNFSK